MSSDQTLTLKITGSAKGRARFFWPGGMTEVELPLSGCLVVGRGRDCDVVLSHVTVSRHHAKLEVGDELTLTDLGSSNGTKVGGAMLATNQSAPLRRAESALLGDVVMVIDLPAVVGKDVGHSQLVASDGTELSKIVAQAEQLASLDLPVIIQGETGVGKGALAHHIHLASPRKHGPFLAIGCGTLEELVPPDELFGSSSLSNNTPGVLEAARSGTLLLDQVEDMPLRSQAKLIDAIDEGQAGRVRGTPSPIPARLVATTSVDLKTRVSTGEFRKDLYFRLAGDRLYIPPLRERKNEIPKLVDTLLRRIAAKDKYRNIAIAAEALQLLVKHSWPGNVRELERLLERAILFSSSSILDAELIRNVLGTPDDRPPEDPLKPSRLRTELRTTESKLVEDTLRRANGNQTLAAQFLGVSRRTLVRRIAELGLQSRRNRSKNKP